MEISTREDQLVVKHNRLIESKHAKLTAREKKLLALVIAQIAKDDDTFKLYKIPAYEIKNALNLDSGRIYEQLKDIASKLDKRRVFIEDVKAKSWQILHFVSTVKYEDGFLYIKLHEELAPFLLKLYKEYTAYELKNVLLLGSSYSITIYEWLKKWVKLGKREISLLDLKDRLGIEEIDPYSNFKDFRRRILEPAIIEINEKTDLIFSYETIKERRKIVSIIFYIKAKNDVGTIIESTVIDQKETTIEQEQLPIRNTLRDKLIVDLSPWFHYIKAEQIIDEFGEDEKRIEGAIKYFNSEQKKGTVINKPEGFIYMAIKNGLGLLSPLEEKKEIERLKKIEEENKIKEEKEKKEAKEKELTTKAWEEFLNMPEDEKAIITGQILSKATESARNSYKERGLNSKIFRGDVIIFIKESWKNKS